MHIETGADDTVVVERTDGTDEILDTLTLDTASSHEVFARTGTIKRVRWILGEETTAAWRRRATADGRGDPTSVSPDRATARRPQP
jgi:hypothetical protein